jgi:hypothetical protein
MKVREAFDQRAQDRMRRLESLRASEIPVDPIAGLVNPDGSPVANVQQALAALAARP